MPKGIDEHIIEKHELADAAIDLVKHAMQDMASYGFGREWQRWGDEAYRAYRRVVKFWPEAPFGDLTELQRWAKANHIIL